jgi:hypothetical protein
MKIFNFSNLDFIVHIDSDQYELLLESYFYIHQNIDFAILMLNHF